MAPDELFIQITHLTFFPFDISFAADISFAGRPVFCDVRQGSIQRFCARLSYVQLISNRGVHLATTTPVIRRGYVRGW